MLSPTSEPLPAMVSVLSELGPQPQLLPLAPAALQPPQLWPAGAVLAGLTHSVVSGTLSRPQALPVSSRSWACCSQQGVASGRCPRAHGASWRALHLSPALDLDLAPDCQGRIAVSFSGWKERVGKAQTLEIQVRKDPAKPRAEKPNPWSPSHEAPGGHGSLAVGG